MHSSGTRASRVAPVTSRVDWPQMSALSEDRCDVGHPTLQDTRCALRVGHGSRHAGSTRAGDSHAWD
jgi:hypothetical protein